MKVGGGSLHFCDTNLCDVICEWSIWKGTSVKYLKPPKTISNTNVKPRGERPSSGHPCKGWLLFHTFQPGLLFPENLESLERGELVKDYSGNNAGTESEDDDDPKTPTSVSSQGSQGYDSAGSDFVDVEGFTSITDSSLPELNLQVKDSLEESVEMCHPGLSRFLIAQTRPHVK